MTHLLAILARLFAAPPADPAAIIAAQIEQCARVNQESRT